MARISKRDTVKKLEELILFMKPDFKSVTLTDDAKYVIASCKNGHSYKVYVDGDSNEAIVKEVVEQIIYK